jgi:hypothetical protein
MSRKWRAAALTGALFFCVAHAAIAQDDCSKLSPEFKSVCQEASQLMQSC